MSPWYTRQDRDRDHDSVRVRAFALEALEQLKGPMTAASCPCSPWHDLSKRQGALRLSSQGRRGPMPSHKFKVGDIVVINPAISRFVPSGVFEVTKQLPGNGEREYRIKSANEPHERVARESELIKA